MRNLFILLLILICYSCKVATSATESSLGSYSRDSIFINPENYDLLDTMSYDITDLIPLDLPSSFSNIDFNQIRITKERIYVLDQKFNKTVFVFDHKGQFLFRMGKVGHARDEFIATPTSFDINTSTGDVYIFEDNSLRILVFNKDGKYIKTLKFNPYKDVIPRQLARLDNGHFLFAMPSPVLSSSHSLLSLHDESLNLIKPLIKYTDDRRSNGIHWFDTAFSHDTPLAFTPFGSDSVFVFSGDKVDKVIKLDFDGQFVSDEIVDQAHQEKTWDPLFKHQGAQFISDCHVSDSLIHIRYAYLMHEYNFVHYFSDKRSYNSHSDCFIKYGILGNLSSVYEDKLIYSFSADDIADEIKEFNAFPKEIQKWILDGGRPALKKIIENKITGPLIMMIKLK